jgi:hypothetical protein
MSILFHHYKELIQCISEVKLIETKITNSKQRLAGRVKEVEEEQEIPATLDRY